MYYIKSTRYLKIAPEMSTFPHTLSTFSMSGDCKIKIF